MSDIERYKKLASALSFKTDEGKFKPEDVVEIVVDGETIKVGPFTVFNSLYEEGYYWQENPTEDEFVLYLLSEDWDSWGEMYADFGTDFSIGKIIKYEPVIEELYADFPTPPRIRW